MTENVRKCRQLTDISSQLQTHLNTESEASTSGASPDVQQIADDMAWACPGDDPASWDTVSAPGVGARCVRTYLVGFPLELARQVVLTHGKFGFRFDLLVFLFLARYRRLGFTTRHVAGHGR
jgi:hypothetical protein